MIEKGQIWQHKSTGQQVIIKNVDNKIIFVESLPGKQPIFLTVIGLEQEYQLAAPLHKAAVVTKSN